MRRSVLAGLGAVLCVAVVAALLRQPEPDLFASYRDKADRGYSGYTRYRRSSNDLVRHDFLSVAGSAEAMIGDLKPELLARGYKPDPRNTATWAVFTRGSGVDQVRISWFRHGDTDYISVIAQESLSPLEQLWARITPRKQWWSK